jgi:hypothetical protein
VFFSVVSSLSSAKRIVIEEYGFGSLLIFQKCPIPPAFFRWVVDHVHVSTSSILLNGISIPSARRLYMMSLVYQLVASQL